MAYIQFNDIPLDSSLTQKRSQRVQRAQFGDGYSQTAAVKCCQISSGNWLNACRKHRHSNLKPTGH